MGFGVRQFSLLFAENRFEVSGFVGRFSKASKNVLNLCLMIGVVRDSWQQGVLAVHLVSASWNVHADDSTLMTSRPNGWHIIHLSHRAGGSQKGFEGVARSFFLRARIGFGLESPIGQLLPRLAVFVPEFLSNAVGSKRLR